MQGDCNTHTLCVFASPRACCPTPDTCTAVTCIKTVTLQTAQRHAANGMAAEATSILHGSDCDQNTAAAHCKLGTFMALVRQAR